MMNSKKPKNNKKPKVIKKEIGTVNYKNKNIGFSFNLPNNWLEVKKSSYEELGINSNTLFIFVPDKFTSFTGVFSGFGEEKVLNKVFKSLEKVEDAKVLYKDSKEFNKIVVKQIVLEKDNRKILNNICLINGMIINLTINIDPKNRIFEGENLVNDNYYKMMEKILESIELHPPVNPPIFVEGRTEKQEEKQREKIKDKINDVLAKVKVSSKKKLAQTLVETDCKYKRILTPEFYFKYLYTKDNSNVVLSVLNNEVYFKGLNDSFRFIKVNEDLSNQIKNILVENIASLIAMEVNTESKTNSSITLKIEDLYTYIDLNNNKNDMTRLEEIFYEIVSKIKEVSDIDLSKEVLFPEEEIEIDYCNISDDFEVELIDMNDEDEFIVELIDEVKTNDTLEEQKEETNKKEEYLIGDDFEVKFIPPLVDEDALDESFEVELIEDKKEETNISDDFEVEFISPLVDEDAVESNLEEETTVAAAVIPVVAINEIENQNEMDTPNVQTSEIIDDLENKNEEIEIPNVISEVQEERNMEEIREKNPDFQEYFHNVDGHASFKFIFPYNIGEKVIRDFNVFDIVNYDSLIYRVFLFKCENEEKYNLKLENWMNKNIETSSSKLKETFTTKTNNIEIKTYILENDKYYKVSYIYGYLIAISGFYSEESLAFANIALENVEIGEDSRSFVDSYDRKMRSINILQAQQIPYIDELPPLKSVYDIKGKTLDDIAKRAIVLCICCNFASDIISNKKKRYVKESKKFFNKLIDTFNVKDAMTKDEKLLFDKMDQNLAIQISWQFEGYLILLWTLGLVDEIVFPDTLVDPDSVTAIVSACDSYREFVGKCNLRTCDEVLDLADLTYRYNWYCVESKLNDEEPIMNPEVVMERHRALNWILSEEKWDKVEINT